MKEVIQITFINSKIREDKKANAVKKLICLKKFVSSADGLKTFPGSNTSSVLFHTV